MSLLLYASAFLALALHGSAQGPLINVDAKSGDTISGDRSFRVTVDSPSAVTQVEFYVGSELRDTETSTPYVFPFDSINQPDGDVSIKFKAYTADSKTAEKNLTLHVDNKKGAGADFHVKAGQDALTNSQWAKALDEGRIALKIDPQSNPGRLILARAYLGEKTFDKAQQFAQEAVRQDPKDDAALQLLAAINVRQAFNIYAREGVDKSEVLTTIGDAFKAAVKARRQSLDVEADKFGTVTDQNRLAYVDALLQGERYSAAIALLQPLYGKKPEDLTVTNRLAYAELRSGRYTDAITTLEGVKTYGQLDAYSDAVLALAYLQLGRNDDSDKVMEAGVEADPDNLGLRTAQAFIALKRNKTSVLSTLVSELGKEEGQRAGVNYFLMALADRQQRYGDARKYFEVAALAEPALPDIYIEQANYTIGLSQAKGIDATEQGLDYKEAGMYYETALVARPEAADALAGLSVVYLLQKNTADAVKYARAARDAAPNFAVGHYALSAADEAAHDLGGAQAELTDAAKLDQTNLAGVEVPTALAVWRYLITGGRIPVMSAP